MAEKLKIIPGKQEGESFSSLGSAVEISFNPTEYSVSESNDFAESQIPGLSAPIIQFKQGKARSLNLELMLDTYLNDQDTKEDIRTKYIEPLEKMINIDSDLHAPPLCRIVWGSLDFVGVLESLDKKYILFGSDGTPVRARVTLKVKEYTFVGKKVKGEPLNSPDRRKLFKVNEGDTIWQLSYKAYGDAGQWRAIADANHLHDPVKLEAGRDLIIPVLSTKNRR